MTCFPSHDRKAHTGVREWECRVCQSEVTDIKVGFFTFPVDFS